VIRQRPLKIRCGSASTSRRNARCVTIAAKSRAGSTPSGR
jgi:hypothetical protein